MNKYKFILGVAAVGLTFASCSEPLEAPNKSAMSEDVIFSTETLADAAVMGLHQSFGETNSYRGRYIPYFGLNTDAEIFNNYGGLADPSTDKEGSLVVYSAHPDNTYMNTDNNAWAKLYEAIERANKAIESMELYGNIEDKTNTNMRQLYGELLTLRGMIYFDLVKAWGDVPYRFSPINSETIYVTKTDRVTVLKKVMEDLLKAEDYVGWPNENNYTKSVERVSKSFTKGLRARIALFLAGYSQWPTAEGDHSGSELRYNLSDAGERQEMYQIARDECVSIINAGVNTLGTFEENFRALWSLLLPVTSHCSRFPSLTVVAEYSTHGVLSTRMPTSGPSLPKVASMVLLQRCGTTMILRISAVTSPVSPTSGQVVSRLLPAVPAVAGVSVSCALNG
jgi:hypothetical protein